jgi:hypothetical protein
VGILQSLKYEYANDYLETVTQLIHANLFSDYLQMAEHLLEEGYKDPSAVIIGSTLEGHLRKLCVRLGIAIDTAGRPVKADKLNADLFSSNAYNSLCQKSISSWLDLRNKAAHGKYAEYTKEQVANMLSGIREFLRTNPA